MKKSTQVGITIMVWCIFGFLVFLPLAFLIDSFVIVFFFWQLIGFTSAMLFFFNKIGLEEASNGQ